MNADRVQISQHAKLRFLSRVDPTEPYPAERLREMLGQATPTREQVGEGLGWAVDSFVIVTDPTQEAVRTVLRRTTGGESE